MSGRFELSAPETPRILNLTPCAMAIAKWVGIAVLWLIALIAIAMWAVIAVL